MVKQLLTALVVGLVAGAALSYYLFPQVETREVVKQEVVVQNRVRTIIRTVERPDGSTETTEERTDNSTSTAQSSSESVKYRTKNWNAAALATVSLSNLQPVYGAVVQRRVLGPVFAGLTVRADGEFGLSLGMEF